MAARSSKLLGAITCFAVALASCRAGGYVIRADERLTIVSPPQNGRVARPVVLRWRLSGDLMVGRGGLAAFGVFVDHSPMPAGRSLRDLGNGDPVCRRNPGCPDQLYLRRLGAYQTTQTQFEIPTVTDSRPLGRPSAADGHEATIVLLDKRGTRIGEAFWTVEFTVDHSHESV